MHLVQCWTCPVDTKAATYPVEYIDSSGKKQTCRMCAKCRDEYAALKKKDQKKI